MKTQNMNTFYALIFTQILSIIGSRVSGLVIGIWIVVDTGNAAPLTLVFFFAALPVMFSAGIAGVLTDRWDRRYVMAISDAGQAVGTVALLISFSSGNFELWHLYIVSFIQAIFAVFQAPAFGAAITMLVPDEKRDRANAIRQMTGPASNMIAAGIAVMIYSGFGVVGALVIDLITFVVAVAVVLNIYIPRPRQTAVGKSMQGSAWKEVWGGLHYLWERKPLLFLVVYIGLINFILSMGVLLTPYVLARTGEDEVALGLVIGIGNMGAILGAVIIGVWGGTRPRMYTLIPAVIFMGFFMVIFGMSQHPPTLIATHFGVMLMVPMLGAMIMSMLQIKVAPDVQGRVFATMRQISVFLSPVALLLAGPLADDVFEPMVGTSSWNTFAPFVGNGAGSGMGLIMVICGIIMAITSIVALAIPKIRNLESILPDYEPLSA